MMDENEVTDNFYHRIYGEKDGTIWETEIHEFLHENNIKLEVMGVVDEEDSKNLDLDAEMLLFVDEQGKEIATLERNSAIEADILDEEVEEYRQMMGDFYPEKNRPWVLDYLDGVKYCYVFTLNTENINDDNWESIAQLCDWLRDDINGIELSDGGMITNQDGDVILVIPDDENDTDPEKESWYPIQVALRDGETWQGGEIETAEDAAAFINGKILE